MKSNDHLNKSSQINWLVFHTRGDRKRNEKALNYAVIIEITSFKESSYCITIVTFLKIGQGSSREEVEEN